MASKRLNLRECASSMQAIEQPAQIVAKESFSHVSLLLQVIRPTPPYLPCPKNARLAFLAFKVNSGPTIPNTLLPLLDQKVRNFKQILIPRSIRSFIHSMYPTARLLMVGNKHLFIEYLLSATHSQLTFQSSSLSSPTPGNKLLYRLLARSSSKPPSDSGSTYPSPPHQLNATGKNTNACALASRTSASQIRK